MSGELIKELLSLDAGQITLTGLLLGFIFVSAWALAKDKIVTGGRHQDLKETCTKCEAALLAANGSLEIFRERDVQSRLELERLRVQREYGWQLPTTPPRIPEKSS